MLRVARQPMRARGWARLLASPGWALAWWAACALLCAAAMFPAWYGEASAQAALNRGLAAHQPGSPAGSADIRALVRSGVLSANGEAVLLERLQSVDNVGPAVLTELGVAGNRTVESQVSSRGVTGRSTLWAREGALKDLGYREDDDVVLLADTVASRLRLETGDRFTLRLAGPSQRATAELTLTGTYRLSGDGRTPEALVGTGAFLPAPLDLSAQPSPPLVMSREGLRQVARRVNEKTILVADLPLQRTGLRPADAIAVSAEIASIAGDAYAGGTVLEAVLAEAVPNRASLELSSALPGIVKTTAQTRATVRSGSAPITAGTIVAAGLLVGGVWALVLASRRDEAATWVGHGVSAREAVATGLIESAWGIVTALPAGLLVAGLTVAWLAPDGVWAWPPGTELGSAVGVAIAAMVAAVALAVCFAHVRAVSSMSGTVLTQHAPGGLRTSSRVPWRAVVLSLSTAVVLAVVATEPQQRARSILVTPYPFAVAVGVGVVVFAVAAKAHGIIGWRAATGSSRWLAARRVRGVGTKQAVLLTVAVGFSLVAYAQAVTAGVNEGNDDKQRAVTPASVVTDVVPALGAYSRAEMAAVLLPGATVVYEQSVTLPPVFGDRPLLVVEPAEVAATLDPDGSRLERRTLKALTALKSPTTESQVPVLSVGNAAMPEQGSLNFYDEFEIKYRVVGRLEAFPGSQRLPGSLSVVAATSSLFPEVPQYLRPGVQGAETEAGSFQTVVWSQGSPDDVAAAFNRYGLVAEQTQTAAQTASRSDLLAARWAATPIKALGGLFLLLSAAAVLVVAQSLRERDRVADIVTGTGGLTGTLRGARAWEVGFAVSAATLSAIAANVALANLPATVDLVPEVLPGSSPALSLATWTVLAVGGILATALGVLVAARVQGAEDAEEALRGR